MSKTVVQIRGVLVLAVAMTASREAVADEADVCIGAYEKSQILRKQGHLLDAQEQLLACKRAECPELARKDCAQWWKDVQESTPSVVFSASDAEGHDVTAVRVLVDGVELLPRLDGKARSVDPGIHIFRYEPADGEPIEQQVVMHEGEKNRVLTVAVRPSVPSIPSSPDSQRAYPPPPVAYVLAGIGVAGIASFAYFGATALHDRNQLRDSCSPHCDGTEVDAVRNEVIAANVSLGIGVAAAAAAGFMFFLAPRRNPQLVFTVRPTFGGGTSSLEGRF